MRILIAEDDLTTRTVLIGILKKWGYEPQAYKDGRAAWEALTQPDAPKLAILDWLMPEMSGVEVIRKVRAQFSSQLPYMILLTSKDEKGDILSGLESGANDYIKKPFDHEELFARMRVGQRTIELQTNLLETQQVLEHLATHDPLTGILNRRAILEQLAKELARTKRGSGQSEENKLSIGYLDIDVFKHINDHYGHQTGDDVLKTIVSAVSGHLREYDTIGRLGGDEFLAIVPGTGGETREHLFTRLLNAISLCNIMNGPNPILVTASIGVATASSDSTVDSLLDQADSAMYQAKRRGGHQVFFSKS